MNCSVQATAFRSSKEATEDKKNKWCVEEKIFSGFYSVQNRKKII